MKRAGTRNICLFFFWPNLGHATLELSKVLAYLHGTTLSHATSLRHELFRENQTYNSLTTPKSCRRPVKSLSHATKSYRVNRPLQFLLSVNCVANTQHTPLPSTFDQVYIVP